MDTKHIKISDYNYDLPDERIAGVFLHQLHRLATATEHGSWVYNFYYIASRSELLSMTSGMVIRGE